MLRIPARRRKPSATLSPLSDRDSRRATSCLIWQWCRRQFVARRAEQPPAFRPPRDRRHRTADRPARLRALRPQETTKSGSSSRPRPPARRRQRGGTMAP